jgi:hypothetical protein
LITDIIALLHADRIANIVGVLVGPCPGKRRGQQKSPNRTGQGFVQASDLLAVILTWPQAGRLQITTVA